jgi:nitrate/nitrite transporter NarK
MPTKMFIKTGYWSSLLGSFLYTDVIFIVFMFPFFLLWKYGNSLSEVYVYSFLLGIAGVSVAAALPLADRWYPP